MKTSARALVTLVAGLVATRTAGAAGLRGSPASMQQQHRVAVEEAYTFLATPAQVRAFVEEGRLEPVTANADVALSGVAYPYARPEILRFVDRLGAQYHAATGERLVVTSLVRPTTRQPTNASALSVHPAGMAVDLRVPANAANRRWLERTLLALEQDGVLDVTRELHPSHFHVAVFPAAYRAYVDAARPTPTASSAPVAASPTAPVAPVTTVVAATHGPRTADVAGVAVLVAFVLTIGAVSTATFRGERRAS